ncbi:MAG: HAMP domain-containing sensor histidine kinase [bacterium]
MRFGSKKLLIAVSLVLLLIVLINLSWWVFYQRTLQILDSQLTRRLLVTARAAAAALPTGSLETLTLGDLDAWVEVSDLLERIRASDSLAELFVIDDNYSVLVSTSLEPDSTYFLAELNGVYIDSILFGHTDKALATPAYRTGDVYLRSAFAPLYDNDGYLLAVLGVEADVDYFDDLTQLRRNLYYSGGLSIAAGVVFGLLFLFYQRRISRAEQHLYLSETHSFLGRMVAVVAHEIKNPLMIIRASAERLGKRHRDEESSFIVEESDRLDEIVTGYLDFAGGGSVLSTDRREQVNLAHLVAGVRKVLTERYTEQTIEWIEDTLPDELVFETYHRSLRQVLVNLLNNGVQACLTASRPAAVGITFEMKDNQVLIRVIDHGPGIDKKELKRIFTPFYTTRQHGWGLGLYLSRKIIVEMGGDLAVTSHSGRKTEITIRLPREQKE